MSNCSIIQIGDTSTPAGRLATVIAEGLGADHPAMADLATLLLAHPAAPQQPPVSLLWQVRKALARAAAICDAVPNRQDGHLGALVNPQPDGTHGYREIHEAEAALVAYLTTPEAAPQQPAPAERGEQTAQGVALKWAEAPARTQWGAGMMEALLPLGKDHTLRLYAEREVLHLVPAALASAPRVPQGWKLVPVEPTTGMLAAAGLLPEVTTGSLRGAWRDMLEAAPTAPGIAPHPEGGA